MNIRIKLAGFAIVSQVLLPAQNNYKYPVTEKQALADDYFGVKVPDPYRWLEMTGTRKQKNGSVSRI